MSEEIIEATEKVETEQPEQTEETEVTEEVQAEAPAEEVTEEPPKKKQTAQERINELTRIRREKEREADYWRKVALEKKEASEPTPEPSIPKRPTLDQFESTVEYEDALFEWRDQVRDIKAKQETQQREQESALRTFNERANKLRAELEDFDEVIEANVFSPIMRRAILNSENGPLLAYHLGKPENWDQAEKIRSLPVELQPYEIGKLESNILLAKQTKKVTSAPAPIKPVGMSGGGSEVDPSKMTTAEWMEWDKQQTLAKIKQKYSGG